MPDRTSEQTAILVAVPANIADNVSDATCGSTSEYAPPAAERGVPLPVNRSQPTRFGHYRIERQLGSGGMGAVYLAVDDRDGRRVALKVLAREALPDSHAVSRFQKEARLLAEVRHPHVTNLLDVGEDQGTCYLIMELVDGVDLKSVLSVMPQMPERVALQIVAQVAEALRGAHARGIVHRDIKPANILLECQEAGQSDVAEQMAARIAAGACPCVKLTDFGLARHIQQSASLELTRTGVMLGTPYYIAPEQCAGVGDLRPGSDVYSLGATLFEMLSGRPPFMSSDPVKLLTLHCFEQPPDLRKLNPEISDGAARLVTKSLSKNLAQRHADAAHLLGEIDQLLRGEMQQIQFHPELPEADDGVTEVRWEWDLETAPAQLWPLVSNTERINCAVGVPAVEYRTERNEHGAIRKVGTFRLGWSTLTWEEHPFEWVEGRRLGVLREFRNGPFQWFASIVELSPRPGGGSHLLHTVRIATRGVLGRLLAHVELNVKGRKSLDRVYRRIDAVASGRLRTTSLADPFVPPAPLRKNVVRRFEVRQQQLELTAADVECAEHLLRCLQECPAQELARIRPRALANRLKVSPERMTDVCLQACHLGLLELHWDILCPTCRVPSSVLGTLRDIERHAYCEACDLDFEVDFQNAVELVFRVHPELRTADLKTYCIGGPEHAPHVVAQVRLQATEGLELDLALEPGTYVLRGPGLPYTVRLDVRGGQEIGRVSVTLGKSPPVAPVIEVHAGRQLLFLQSQFSHPLVVRLERTIPRTDVVTAAQASRLPLFRELFPSEVVSRRELSSFATCTLLGVRVTNTQALFIEFGQVDGFQRIDERMRSIQAAITAVGGLVVREQEGRLLATFADTLHAVQAGAAAIAKQLTDDPGCGERVEVQVVLHQGTAQSRTNDGRLDVFGRTVTTAIGLLDQSDGAPLVLSSAIGGLDEVISYLESIGFIDGTAAASVNGQQSRRYHILPESGASESTASDLALATC